MLLLRSTVWGAMSMALLLPAAADAQKHPRYLRAYADLRAAQVLLRMPDDPVGVYEPLGGVLRADRREGEEGDVFGDGVVAQRPWRHDGEEGSMDGCSLMEQRPGSLVITVPPFG